MTESLIGPLFIKGHDKRVKEAREDNRLMDYLLGNLPEPEQVRLEEAYLADPGVQDHLLMVEDELIDAYVQGQLPALDQKSFEAGFLSTPRGRRKLELARSLKALAAEVQTNQSHSAPRRPFPFFASIRWAFAVPALALSLVLAWSIWTNVLRHPGSGKAMPESAGNGNNQMSRQTVPAIKTQADNASTAAPVPLPIPTISPSSGSPVSTVAFITLRPAIRGIEQAQRVKIDRSTLHLRINLELPVDSDGRYRVVLLAPNDEMKWKQNGIKTTAPSKKTIVLKLPTILFENGEYTLVVSSEAESTGPVAEYSFLVYKR